MTIKEFNDNAAPGTILVFKDDLVDEGIYDGSLWRTRPNVHKGMTATVKNIFYSKYTKFTIESDEDAWLYSPEMVDHIINEPMTDEYFIDNIRIGSEVMIRTDLKDVALYGWCYYNPSKMVSPGSIVTIKEYTVFPDKTVRFTINQDNASWYYSPQMLVMADCDNNAKSCQ